VHLVKAFGNPVKAALIELLDLKVDGEAQALAVVADIDLVAG
jgi:hypothetical protein